MKYLSDYMQDAQTNAFEEAGAFFAFSQNQLNEKKKDGIIYVNMGAGLICPKQNAKALSNRLDSIYAEGMKQDVSENGTEAIIEREYFNHETQLTMDNSSVVELLADYEEHFPGQFTEETVLKVCKLCFKKAVKNDWF